MLVFVLLSQFVCRLSCVNCSLVEEENKLTLKVTLLSLLCVPSKHSGNGSGRITDAKSHFHKSFHMILSKEKFITSGEVHLSKAWPSDLSASNLTTEANVTVTSSHGSSVQPPLSSQAGAAVFSFSQSSL